MIDLNKIKQRIIASLTAEARGMVESEAQFLERIGYPAKAAELAEWIPCIEEWDEEVLIDEIAETTRLERQARGELQEIEVGDYVVELDSYPDQRWVWRVDYIKPARKITLNNGEETDIEERIDIAGNGFIGSALTRHYRLATPQELLDAGIIDELPTEEERHCTDHRGPEVVARDANGEVLEVGDIVINSEKNAAIIRHIYFDYGDFWIAKGDGSRDQSTYKVTKATTLTHDQYIPLARRTMDPDLMGDHPAAKKARLLYLMTGVFDEYNEFFIASEFDGTKEYILDEAGDVLWYAEQLAEEVEVIEGLEVINVSKFPTFFVLNHIKKAAVHQREESIKFIGECLEEILREVSQSIEHLGSSVGEIRLANIRKLIERYPDGFVLGGGER